MKFRKFNSKYDFKKEGIEVSFSLFPTIIYRRYSDKMRVIFFAWLWFSFGGRLSNYQENYIIIKYKAMPITKE